MKKSNNFISKKIIFVIICTLISFSARGKFASEEIFAQESSNIVDSLKTKNSQNSNINEKIPVIPTAEPFQKKELSKKEIQEKLDEISQKRTKFYENKIVALEKLDKYYRKYIEDYPNSPFIADVYYHLADICYELYDLSESKTYSEIIEFYEKLLKIKPDFVHKDVVFYNLAFYHRKKEDILLDEKRHRNPELLAELPDSLRLLKNNLEKSIEFYEKLVTECPNSEYYQESKYRLAEIYFDLAGETNSPNLRADYLITSENYYQSLSTEKTRLHENIVYMLGWTYFSKNDYSSAITQFIRLLNEISINDSIIEHCTESVVVDNAKQNLEKAKNFETETLKYLALSFAGYDSDNYSLKPIGTKKFAKIVGKIKSKDYAKTILLKLAEIYDEINFPMKSIATYDEFLTLFHLHKNNPSIENIIVNSYLENNMVAKAESEKEKIAYRFTANSEWYKKNKDDKDVIKNEIPIIKEAYEFEINKRTNDVIEDKSPEKYNKAIEISKLYLDLFPTSEKSKDTENNVVQMYFDLSEIENDTTSYYLVIDKLEELGKKYPDDPKRLENAYNIIFAYQSILNIILKDGGEKKDTLLAISKKSATYDSLLSTCDNYRKLFAEKPEVTSDETETLLKVLKLQGDIYFSEKKNYAEALLTFEEILKFVDEDEKTDFTYNIGICHKELGNYVSSEEWFEKAEKLAVRTKNKKIKESSASLILESIQNQASQLEDSDDLIGAAQQLERLAKTDLKADYSFDNMLSAAKFYKKANDFENAIRTYLFIAENYDDLDKDEQIIPLYYNVATIVDSFLNDYEREIKIYEKIVERYPNSKDSRNAELKIISLYDDENKLNDLKIAANKYLELAEKYRDWENSPDMFDNAIFNYNELSDTTQVVRLMLEFTEKYPEHPSVLGKFKKILSRYIGMDRWSKAEEIALHINRKFPEEKGIAKGVAKEILAKIETEIDTLFENKNYAEFPRKIKEYRKKDEYFRRKDVKLNLKSQYAKHIFYASEIVYNELIQDTIRKTTNMNAFNRGIKRVLGKKSELESILASIKDYNNPKWWSAAIHRLGQSAEYTFSKLDRATIMFAPTLNEVDEEAMIDIMSSDYIFPAYDEMLQYYTANFTFLEEQGLENEWTLASREKLYEYGELERPEENYEYLTMTTDSTWNYSNTYQKGFSEIDFVDSLSTFHSPKLVGFDTFGIDNLSFETDAEFIWGSSSDTTLYFRKVFEINGFPEIAKLNLISPNDTYIFINGIMFEEFYTFENEENWKFGKQTDISDKLNLGKNVIAVQSVANTNQAEVSSISDVTQNGILMNLKIKARIPIEEIVSIDTFFCSNENWLVSPNYEYDWNNLTFNDSLWSKSEIISVDSLSPFSEIIDSTAFVIWDSLESDTAYFRYKFFAPDSVEFAEIEVAADTSFSLYINGKEIAKDSLNIVILEKYQPAIIDISDYVIPGENIFAIKVIANKNSYGFISKLRIIGIIKKLVQLDNSCLLQADNKL